MAKTAPVKMSVEEVLDFLKQHGNESAKPMLMKHGARDPLFGTRVADIKKLVRKIGKDHELSLALYETGNSDAMYLAGLIADETRITRAELSQWVRKAYWYMLAESTVAWVAAESPHGRELAREWIDSPEEMIAAAGWATWSSLLSIVPNEELDLAEIDRLLERAERTVHTERNRVRYAINSFIISVGAYVPSRTERAKEIGSRVGKVAVDMGGTACKVPLITPYIEKIEARGAIGKKRKTARC
jgi:3-methyladenine DNA glycosylase AlkD